MFLRAAWWGDDHVRENQLKRANPARAGDAKRGVSYGCETARLPVLTVEGVYMFKKYLFSSSALGLMALAMSAIPVQAASAATLDTSMCTSPSLTQAFLGWGDQRYYAPLPGETTSSFNGTGWTLSGGAKIVTTTLPSGATSTVLDLPSKSKAVSPTICVTSAYPVARGWVRDLKGSEGVFFYVSYAGTNTWTSPKNTGQIHGSGTSWGLVTPVNLQPYNTSGWQPMKITLVGGGTTSEFQVSNLQVDPRMRG
jgi:hypothetical protein